jgi:Flp pilus assembly protein TadB
MANNQTTSETTLLQIAFIVLKLCNVITWSWWWVLAPTWILVGFVLIMLIGLGIYNWVNSRKTKQRLSAGLNEYGWRKLRD